MLDITFRFPPLGTRLCVTKRFLVYVCLQFVFFAGQVRSDDLYSAIAHLEDLLTTEQQVIQSIHRYQSLHHDRLEELQFHHAWSSITTGEGVGNVVRRFKTMADLSWTWAFYYDRNSLLSRAIVRAMMGFLSRYTMPSDDDLSGAAVGLCRLLNTYMLTSAFLISLRSAPRPTVSDLVLIASSCLGEGYVEESLTWATAALEESVAKNAAWESAVCVLSNATYSLQNVASASDVVHKALSTAGPPERGILSKVKELYDKEIRGWTYPQGKTWQRRRSQFERSCAIALRGAPLRASSELRCKMTTNGRHPALILQPIKMEVISVDPWFVLFHDFISAQEAEEIKSHSRRHLKRATTVHQDGAMNPVPYRVSKSYFLEEHVFPAAKRVETKIFDVTGLSGSSAENFQIAHYGVGGHYITHTDYTKKDQSTLPDHHLWGNRLATVLMYLTDVKSGGATAFVEANVAVRPQRGLALFWFNMLRAEDENSEKVTEWSEPRYGDRRTSHCACPVLEGSKWIATKWFREKDQGVVKYRTPI
ncbi:prolyl 4-hydroxylase subunit alpha-1-like [Ornithodoros turicata]|uniref:prolyl 4-hydroxylase subunit alpha-1-like n=1 Tax=Ornithodoros turicata TaxID=34597 RepID=UPI003139BE63